MVFLMLACSSDPPSGDTGLPGSPGQDSANAETAVDTGDTATDTGGDTSEDTGAGTAEVTVTNVGELVLFGTFYWDEWMLVEGVGLEPEGSTTWTLEAPVTGNLVYVDWDTELCWGVGLSLAPGDVLHFDVPDPEGELSWDGELRTCDLPSQ